jgi:hypothetical protein
VSGDVVATRLAVTAAFAAARKLTERSTQEKLLKYACQHPEAPRLNRGQKRRLMKAVRQQSSLDAMLDQNEAGASVLSVIIARDVFRSPESAESLTLAWVLIAEISKCVTEQEWKSLTTYQLRRIEEVVGGVGDQVTEVGEEVRGARQDIRDLGQELRRSLSSSSTSDRMDPQVLIDGPLRALGLEAEYATIRSMEAAEPAAAAARLTALILRIEETGHHAQARPFSRHRAELLTRGGNLAALEAWIPLA